MGWMGLSLRVRILSIIAIVMALALIAIASWENARGTLPHHSSANAAAGGNRRHSIVYGLS